MRPDAEFTTEDIYAMALAINMPIKNRALNRAIDQLDYRLFRAVKRYVIDMDTNVPLAPLLSFGGEWFEFGVLDTQIGAQFLQTMLFEATDGDGSPMMIKQGDRVFEREKLNTISADFEYILGLVLQQLERADRNHAFEFHLNVSKMCDFTKSFSHLLSPDSSRLISRSGNLDLNRLLVEVREEMFGVPARLECELRYSTHADGRTLFEVNAQIDFQRSGLVDFFGFMDEGLDRLNALAAAAANPPGKSA